MAGRCMVVERGVESFALRMDVGLILAYQDIEACFSDRGICPWHCLKNGNMHLSKTADFLRRCCIWQRRLNCENGVRD